MHRRTFLKVTGIGSTAAVAGALAYRVGGVWWEQGAAENFQALSAHEAKIARAIADAMFPGDHLGMPNGVQAGVVEALDDFMASVDTQTANLLKFFLHAIDEMAVLSNFGMTRFHRRPREQRIKILQAWEQSMLATRRMAFQGLKFVMATGYCESPAVLQAAGIVFSCGGEE